jgi:hypothetical protein
MASAAIQLAFSSHWSNTASGAGAGAAVIEIVATLLTVKFLVPMSGLEQAVPKVD